MGRLTGSWLSGPRAALTPEERARIDRDKQRWRGERLGLPEEGPGSIALTGRRIAALFVDWLPCAVLAQLFTKNPGLSALVLFALLTVVSLALFNRTPGHAALGLVLTPVDAQRQVFGRFGRAVVRTVLLCLVIPALIWDADTRGLHDKAVGTVLVRAGRAPKTQNPS